MKSHRSSKSSSNLLSSDIFSNESSNLSDDNQPHPGFQILSPGMKILIRDCIDTSILEMRAKLEEFVVFVEEIQEQVPSDWEMVTVVPLKCPLETENNSSNSDTPLRRPFSEDMRPKNAALRDAFYIVRKFLMRISKLMMEIALHANPDDMKSFDVESPDFNFYYAHYVFQLAIFVLKILKEQVNIFSESLNKEIKEKHVGIVPPTTDKIAIDSFPAFSYVRKKQNKIKLDNKNQDLNFQSNIIQETNVLTAPTEPGTFLGQSLPRAEFKTKVFQASSNLNSSNNDLLTRISDALQIITFLSEKLLHWIQETSVTNYKRVQLPTSGPHLSSDEKKLEFLKFFKEKNQEVGRDKNEHHISHIYREISNKKERKERISISGLFNIDTFAKKLNEELCDYKLRDPTFILGQSEHYEASLIMDIVMNSFKESSVSGEVVIDRKLEDETLLNVKDILDENLIIDEKDTRSEVPGFVTCQGKSREEILRKFAEESIRIAVQNVERKRQARKLTTEKEKKTLAEKIPSKQDNNKPEESGGLSSRVKNREEYSKILKKDCSSCSEQTDFLLSNILSKDEIRRPTKDIFPTTGLHWRYSKKLHQNHTQEEDGLAEIREVDGSGNVLVTMVKWIENLDSKQERWERNIQQKVSHAVVTEVGEHEKDIQFLQHRQAPRHSIAETQLPIVQEVAEKFKQRPSISKNPSRLKKHASLENSLPGRKKEEVDSILSSISIEKPKSLNEQKIKKDPSVKDNQEKEKMEKFDIINKLLKLYDNLKENSVCDGPPLILKIRELTLLDDAFSLLMAPSNINLNHYRFIIAYIITRYDTEQELNLEEEDQTEDFFLLLIEKLFSSHHQSLFDYPSEETDCLYPNSGSFSHPVWFEFAGVILAICILHQEPLGIKFPLCFFKCLLDRPFSLEDLEEIDPILYQRLVWIKENDISDRKIPFTVRDKLGNEIVDYNLSTNDIQVNEDNKLFYIEKCLKWKIVESCLEQLKNIRRGFLSVLDPKFLSEFSVEELQRLCFKPLNEIASSEDDQFDANILKERRSL